MRLLALGTVFSGSHGGSFARDLARIRFACRLPNLMELRELALQTTYHLPFTDDLNIIHRVTRIIA